ncbi:hypothetical protein SAMN05660976_08560 [Nonomuraea pusilla]|uniref:Uncharacterized protein n=1 Tax=Nonomuraea pusilla TaxID=46177 RepID=A0A1H8KA57_9ACTN|nr:hypothetical protein SAMN05660976_08560 [Nonomuraea pusilla]
MIEWFPYIPRGSLRVRETSCCGEYEWCCEGGQYFVLRKDGPGHEETRRGTRAQIRELWDDLMLAHASCHSDNPCETDGPTT